MEFVGDILKKTRENRKISLPNISKELKISEEILTNLENNHLQKDIDRVFIIGHLRSYCSFLNLNHNEMIELYKLQHYPSEKKNIEIEKPSREYAIIPDLPENFIAVVEEANLNELVNNKDNLLNPEKNFAEIEGSSNSSSAVASISDNEIQKSTIVTLKFLDDTWVQLRDDNDEIILSQLMNEGDEYSYSIFNNYSITSGNAGHILVMINQKVKGKIGKKGQVVDSLVINQNFNN